MSKMQAGVEGAIDSSINSPIGQKISLKLKNNHKNSKKAFSVAEAMIALLIGSVALGMAAPMITKQIKTQNMTDTQFRVMNSQFERLRESNDNTINALIQRIEALEAQNIQIDEGMIAPFALANCPTGWTELTKLYKGADGAFIRNIGGNAKAMSELQNDAAPNLTFQFDIDDNQRTNLGGNMFLSQTSGGRSLAASGDYVGYKLSFAASKASTSYGRDNTTEVRPKNMAFLYCVKTKD